LPLYPAARGAGRAGVVWGARGADEADAIVRDARRSALARRAGCQGRLSLPAPEPAFGFSHAAGYDSRRSALCQGRWRGRDRVAHAPQRVAGHEDRTELAGGPGHRKATLDSWTLLRARLRRPAPARARYQPGVAAERSRS